MSFSQRYSAIGRLGRDPEVRYTPSGMAVAKFSVAVDDSYKKDGEKHERTFWASCEAWGKLAEIIGEYLAKGTQVYIAGTLKDNSWEDREGNKKKQTIVNVRELTILSKGKTKSGDGAGEGRGYDGPGPQDDDIPF